MLKIPVFGREEDAADQLAAFTLLQFGKDVARRTIVGAALLFRQMAIDQKPGTADYAAVHGLPAQRFVNVLCIAYGSDRKLFGDLVQKGYLPQHRTPHCHWEYRQIAHAFRTLISPHVDPVLQEKVRGREWLPASNVAKSQIDGPITDMTIRIGTSEHGGTFHSQGLALKAVLERQPSLAPVEVLTSDTASIENANRLHAGDITFGFMAANWIGRAKNGEAPFRDTIDIRMVAPMNAGPLFFIVRAESPIRSVADLRGRRVVLGPEKSGMVQHVHTIFGVLGLTLLGVHAGLSRFPGWRAGACARRSGRPVPVPDTQQGDDGAKRERGHPRAAVSARRA